MRIQFIKRVTAAGFFVIISGLLYYQVFRGEYFSRRAKANYIRVVPQEAIRGSILDRKGVSLAYDEPTFNIAVIPYQITKDKEAFFRRFSSFGIGSFDSISRSYKQNYNGLFSPVDILADVSKEDALLLKEKLGGDVIIEEIPRRFYPFAQECAHALGYVKRAGSLYKELKPYGYTPDDRVGFLGVEQYYDSYVRGSNGGQLLEVDSTGRIVGFLGKQEPVRGRTITLTIDSRMQQRARQALGERNGAIIVMDPQNGEVFVLYSYPSYDPNDMIRGQRVSLILQNRNKPLINRVIQASYPLGSVFKPIVAVAALEEGAITPYTTFLCKGSFPLGGMAFGCWEPHGEQDLREALVHSCNVYFYNVGIRLGVEPLSYWARKFGLGRITSIDLPYEKSGIVPDARWKTKNIKQQWFKGDTVNMSIGQGYLEVTPLQAVVVLSVFANNGYLVKPHLLKKVEDFETAIASKNYVGVSPGVLQAVRDSLRAIVARPDGTAHILEGLKLGVAGKTGTAQTRGPSHGWFAGFFPHHSPRFVFCVFLENGGSSYEALKVSYKFLKSLQEDGILEGAYE